MKGRSNFILAAFNVVASFSFLVSSTARAAPTPQNIVHLTVTGVGTVDVGSGEITFFYVSAGVVPGCPNTYYYAVRDPNSINPVLALVTAALVGSRPVDIYVTGVCDAASGETLVSSVTIH